LHTTGNCTVDPITASPPCYAFLQIADIGSDKVNKQKSMAIIQQYAMPFLKSSGFELMVQAEAPATPKRHSESNSTILEPFWEDRFPEVLSINSSYQKWLVVIHFELLIILWDL
jgi:hypothetical protein